MIDVFVFVLQKEETFGTKFGNVTRRLGQQMRNTLGGNECVTDDSEYEERKRRIAELRKHYADMEKKFCKYLDAIRCKYYPRYALNERPSQIRRKIGLQLYALLALKWGTSLGTTTMIMTAPNNFANRQTRLRTT